MQRLIGEALPPGADDDDPLYLAACEVERDEHVAAEMSDWDVTIGEGLDAAKTAGP